MTEKIFNSQEAGGHAVDKSIGFARDYRNPWLAIERFLRNVVDQTTSSADQVETDTRNVMRRIEPYSEYVKNHYGNEAEKILSQSDPAAVDFLDHFAGAYNAEIHQIMVDRDWEKLRDYWRTFEAMLNGRFRPS